MLKAFGFDVAILANNHIGDFGGGGTKRRLDVLDAHEIGHLGVGISLQEA